MRTKAIFSSAHDEWGTPQAVYRALNAEFHFDFDPCPLGGSEDGRATLFCDWRGKTAFINPPYSDIRKFLERWHEPRLAVYLLPARTDTRWYHEIVIAHAAEIRFLRGRLRFGGAANSAPFPSMVVIFEQPPLPGQTRIPLIRSMRSAPVQTLVSQQASRDGAQGGQR